VSVPGGSSTLQHPPVHLPGSADQGCRHQVAAPPGLTVPLVPRPLLKLDLSMGHCNSKVGSQKRADIKIISAVVVQQQMGILYMSAATRTSGSADYLSIKGILSGDEYFLRPVIINMCFLYMR
jgi:hypothetical protein